MAVDHKKKKWIYAVVIAVVLIGPLVLISNFGLGKIEKKAIANRQKPWAAKTMMNVARIYGLTLRKKQERKVYEDFLKYFKGHPLCGVAKYKIAVAIENDLQLSREMAVRAYEDFLDEYEDDPAFMTVEGYKDYIREAERAIDRILGTI